MILTDKPSFGKYLVINKKGKLCIWSTDTIGSQITLNPQHIYITSDEEIKGGDWFWKPDYNMIFKAKYTPHIGCKKVILTTDEDLINDGVQKIDDDFLEWFVKNPSCEKVEVNKEYVTPLGDVVETCYDNERLNYKIIIPKQEQKELRRKLFTLIKSLEQEEPKKETLEEFIKEVLNEEFFTNISEYRKAERLMELGAKWNQERSYSEEEVMNMFHNLSMHLPLHYEFLVKEQFKKK